MALKERYLFFTGMENYAKLHPQEGEDRKIEELRRFLKRVLPVPDPTLGTD
jgi:hypothetical protein